MISLIGLTDSVMAQVSTGAPRSVTFAAQNDGSIYGAVTLGCTTGATPTVVLPEEHHVTMRLALRSALDGIVHPELDPGVRRILVDAYMALGGHLETTAMTLAANVEVKHAGTTYIVTLDYAAHTGLIVTTTPPADEYVTAECARRARTVICDHLKETS